QPMIAVRRPVLPIARRDRDHGVEISIEPVDRARQPADVCFRQVALKRRRLDALERKRGQELPVTAERIAIRRQHGPTVVLDRSRQGRNRHGGRGGRETPCVQPARRSGRGGNPLFLGGHESTVKLSCRLIYKNIKPQRTQRGFAATKQWGEEKDRRRRCSVSIVKVFRQHVPHTETAPCLPSLAFSLSTPTTCSAFSMASTDSGFVERCDCSRMSRG